MSIFNRFLMMTLLLCCMSASAQKGTALTITGTVTDENNNPLQNASVTIRGSQDGVSTDQMDILPFRLRKGTFW